MEDLIFSDLSNSSKSPYCDSEGGPHLHFEVLHLHFQVQQTRSYLMIWRQSMPCIYIAKTLFCPQIICLLPQLSNFLVANHSPTASHDLGVTALLEREKPAACCRPQQWGLSSDSLQTWLLRPLLKNSGQNPYREENYLKSYRQLWILTQSYCFSLPGTFIFTVLVHL